MLSASLLEKVLARAQETAAHSWEYGVVFEALLEYYDPHLSVFREKTINSESDVEHVKALQYVKQFIRTDSTSLCEGNGMP
ncbi:six-hairpin glycosidase [Pyrenophora seminiperda CCB06]|uniref:Six-hairpin glycosidase n=1 Tax=Pyrenophora seminiperda CCB06 TaxID=1302712 RepID=A0A3M7LWH7_9PLEO|nr:six-hairpin glycosidase [Pyrenophora seminiperda CCB06]